MLKGLQLLYPKTSPKKRAKRCVPPTKRSVFGWLRRRTMTAAAKKTMRPRKYPQGSTHQKRTSTPEEVHFSVSLFSEIGTHGTISEPQPVTVSLAPCHWNPPCRTSRLRASPCRRHEMPWFNRSRFCCSSSGLKNHHFQWAEVWNCNWRYPHFGENKHRRDTQQYLLGIHSLDQLKSPLEHCQPVSTVVNNF